MHSSNPKTAPAALLMEAGKSALNPASGPMRARDLLQRTAFPIHPFDQMHGVDTSGLVPATHLVTGHANDEHITAYYGVAPSILRALIGHWRETVPPYPIHSYTFIDVGAGKGRGLLVASEYSFRKVAGIELNPEMAAIARQNVEHGSAPAAKTRPPRASLPSRSSSRTRWTSICRRCPPSSFSSTPSRRRC